MYWSADFIAAPAEAQRLEFSSRFVGAQLSGGDGKFEASQLSAHGYWLDGRSGELVQIPPGRGGALHQRLQVGENQLAALLRFALTVRDGEIGLPAGGVEIIELQSRFGPGD